MKKIVILAVGLIFSTLSYVALPGDIAAGKAKVAEKRCLICHGSDGKSMGNPLNDPVVVPRPSECVYTLCQVLN